MLQVFKSSNHYKQLVYYQDKWDVPIWIGEFCWETQTTRQPQFALAYIWENAIGFRYMADESMIKIFNKRGLGWLYWEYAKESFQNDRKNALASKYLKDVWKPSDPIPKLVVSGKQIQTEDGMPVLLKGVQLPFKDLVMYGGVEPTEETFQMLDEIGMNTVRLELVPEKLVPQEGVWDQKAFDTLEKALDLAEKHNIYVILVIHQYKESSFFGGLGFPSWYVQRYDFRKGDTGKFGKMWMARQHPFEDSWDFVVECWKKVIEVSKNRTIVAGYDLFNEPPGAPRKFYEYLSAQIEPLDPDKIHFADTPFLFKGMEDETKPNIHNLVLAPHIYDIWKLKLILIMFVTSTLLFLAAVVVIIISMVLMRRKRKKLRAHVQKKNAPSQ